jgi:hypothetical protein
MDCITGMNEDLEGAGGREGGTGGGRRSWGKMARWAACKMGSVRGVR